MNVKSIILDEVQDLLFSSKDLVEFAEVAAKKVCFQFYWLLLYFHQWDYLSVHSVHKN